VKKALELGAGAHVGGPCILEKIGMATRKEILSRVEKNRQISMLEMHDDNFNNPERSFYEF